MHKFIFLGPSCSIEEIHTIEPECPCIQVPDLSSFSLEIYPENCLFILPPVSGGDLFLLKNKVKDFSVGIIDGYFENTVSVWHKEILDLLANKIPVYGSASMGALRASELASFGMIGIGKIFENFLDGTFEDDDEVTILHGPKELGYPALSEAMVNIRVTLDKALTQDILTPDLKEILLTIAKDLFYKERKYQTIIDLAKDQSVPREELDRFMHWLKDNAVDQKKEDALDLIKLVNTRSDVTNNNVPFVFEDSSIWRHFIGG